MKGILYLYSVVVVFVATVRADLIECPESGQSFHPHPTSCSQFVECRDGEQSVVECMEDFHFDSALGFCNFPEYAGCTLTEEVAEEDEKLIDCPESGQQFYAHPSVCSQFIECNNGEYRVIDCMENFYFNPNLGFCDLPENVVCESSDGSDTGDIDGSGDDVDGEGGEEDAGNSGDGSSQEEQPDDGEAGYDGEVDNSGEGNDDNEVDGGEDETEGDNDGSEDDGENEDEVDGQDSGEVGDGDDGGDGGNGGNGGDGDDNGDDGQGGDNDNGNDDGQSSEDGEWACPASGQHFFPHPLRCSQFIECNNGVPTIVDCLEDFHFNPALGWCDFPENVGCEDSTLTPTTTTTEQPSNEGGPVGECPPLNGQYVDFLTDSRDCDVFYKCNWGVPVKFTCQAPLHFNPNLNVCDWAQNVGCTLG